MTALEHETEVNRKEAGRNSGVEGGAVRDSTGPCLPHLRDSISKELRVTIARGNVGEARRFLEYGRGHRVELLELLRSSEAVEATAVFREAIKVVLGAVKDYRNAEDIGLLQFAATIERELESHRRASLKESKHQHRAAALIHECTVADATLCGANYGAISSSDVAALKHAYRFATDSSKFSAFAHLSKSASSSATARLVLTEWITSDIERLSNAQREERAIDPKEWFLSVARISFAAPLLPADIKACVRRFVTTVVPHPGLRSWYSISSSNLWNTPIETLHHALGYCRGRHYEVPPIDHTWFLDGGSTRSGLSF